MVCVYRYTIECMTLYVKLRQWYGMVTSVSGVGHTGQNKYYIRLHEYDQYAKYETELLRARGNQ